MWWWWEAIYSWVLFSVFLISMYKPAWPLEQNPRSIYWNSQVGSNGNFHFSCEFLKRENSKDLSQDLCLHMDPQRQRQMKIKQVAKIFHVSGWSQRTLLGDDCRDTIYAVKRREEDLPDYYKFSFCTNKTYFLNKAQLLCIYLSV